MEVVSGPASLYKLEKKQVQEVRPYGSATFEQRIINIHSYFILFNNELKKIKKIGDIPELLVPGKAKLEEYIKSNRPGVKVEKDLAKLIAYYNTL